MGKKGNGEMKFALGIGLAILALNSNSFAQNQIGEKRESSQTRTEVKAWHPPEARGLWFYGGADAGFSTQGGTNLPEVNKSGYLLGLKGVLSFYTPKFVFDVGLGWQYTRIEDSSVPITVRTRAGYVELSPRFRLTDSIQLGVNLDILFGTDVSFSENVNESDNIALLAGISAMLELPVDPLRLRIGTKLLTDITVGNRQQYKLIAMVELGFPITTQHPPSGIAEAVSSDQVRLVLDSDTFHFQTGKSRLKAQSRGYLVRLAKFLARNPSIWGEIEVEGHTDPRGGYKYNVKLSQKRAQAVFKHLVNGGIQETRVKWHGYGFTRPVNDENNKRAWAQNRRVEMRFTGVDDPEEFAETLNSFRSKFKPK